MLRDNLAGLIEPMVQVEPHCHQLDFNPILKCLVSEYLETKHHSMLGRSQGVPDAGEMPRR